MDIKQTITGTEPLTIEEVKSYLKADYALEDALIQKMITGVRQKIEEFTGLALVEKTVEVYLDYLPEKFKLPFPDHLAIVEVKINGTVSTDYTKKGLTQFTIIPLTTFTSKTVEESLYVKYTTSGLCLESIQLEMLKAIDEKFRNRGNTFEGSIVDLSENTYANLSQFCLM